MSCGFREKWALLFWLQRWQGRGAFLDSLTYPRLALNFRSSCLALWILVLQVYATMSDVCSARNTGMCYHVDVRSAGFIGICYHIWCVQCWDYRYVLPCQCMQYWDYRYVLPQRMCAVPRVRTGDFCMINKHPVDLATLSNSRRSF